MEFLLYAYIVPLGAFITVLCLMAIQSMKRVPGNDTESNSDHRLRELETLNRIYALDADNSQLGHFVSRPRDGDSRLIR